MRSMLAGFGIVVLATVLAAGCATTGKGVSDQELIRMTMEKMKEALETQNLDLLFETISEDFEHPQVGGKDNARVMLQMALDMGYGDDGEVSLDDMEIEMNDDGTATVYPVDLSSPQGQVAVEISLKKDGDAWLILTGDADI